MTAVRGDLRVMAVVVVAASASAAVSALPPLSRPAAMKGTLRLRRLLSPRPVSAASRKGPTLSARHRRAPNFGDSIVAEMTVGEFDVCVFANLSAQIDSMLSSGCEKKREKGGGCYRKRAVAMFICELSIEFVSKQR